MGWGKRNRETEKCGRSLPRSFPQLEPEGPEGRELVPVPCLLLL